MNPYLAVTLVMCGVIFIALAATAYMAVFFTRRAKADLLAALTPLASMLGSEPDLEQAEVTGRYRGKLAFGRMAHAEGGPVRVFQVELIDASGGEGWLLVQYPKKGTTEVRPPDSPVAAKIPDLHRPSLASDFAVHADWFQVDYSPEAGHVRLTTPMDTRKDIPNLENFQRQLELLDRISDRNRELQEQRPSGTGT